VLGADVVVAERERLAEGELQSPLRARRERDLPGHLVVARPDDVDYADSDGAGVDPERLEHTCRPAGLVAQQTDEQVVGADVVVAERPRLVLRQHDNLPSLFAEPLEHRGSSLARATRP
jgi:hypothetical protein